MIRTLSLSFVPLACRQGRVRDVGRLSFSHTATLLQRPGHKLFRDVDWDRVEGGEYAIVDPVDASAILYLTERDYITQVRVSMTQNHKPIVLATPRDKRPTSDITSSPSSNNSKKSPPWDHRSFRGSIKSLFVSGLVKLRKVVRLSRNNKTEVESLVVVSEGNLQSLLMSWANNLHVRVVGLGSNSNTRKAVFTWSTVMLHLFKHSGVTYLISYLKVSFFVVNAFLAGQRLKTTHPLGIRIKLTNGLPKALPLSVRRMIRSRNTSIIRLWGSLLYSYKAIDGQHKAPEFGTIVKPFEPSAGYELVFSQFNLFLRLEFKEWLFRIMGWSRKGFPYEDLKVTKLHFSVNSGPNHRWMFLSYPMDALYWVFRRLDGDNPLISYLDATGSDSFRLRFFNYIQWLTESLTPQDSMGYPQSDHKILEDLCHVIDNIGNQPSDIQSRFKTWLKRSGTKFHPVYSLSLVAGKLAALPEAAGKVRIIAIVDGWTQSVLKPFHDLLFRVLARIPTDGTFDQQAAVASFAEEGHRDIFSYDLSSATDTIPYTLYGILFEVLIGRIFSDSWLRLLRDRSWLLPNWNFPVGKKMINRRLTHQGQTHIKYGRGQPMGAYSSWGALALLHHAITQFAAFRIGQFPTFDYRVLGDDIVIAGKGLAHSYTDVCAHLGIVIGLPKSFVSSEGFFNFASQSYLGTQNLSPFSLKEELSALSAQGRFAIALREFSRGTISIDSPNWFSQIARIVLPSLTMREVEDDRKRGETHLAVHYLSGLIFGALLEGVKPFDKFQGLGLGLLSSRLVKPSLMLFTMKPEDLVQSRRRVDSALTEGVDLIRHMIGSEYRSCERMGRDLLKRLNALLSSPLVAGTPYNQARLSLSEVIQIMKEMAGRIGKPALLKRGGELDIPMGKLGHLAQACSKAIKLPKVGWELPFSEIFAQTLALIDHRDVRPILGSFLRLRPGYGPEEVDARTFSSVASMIQGLFQSPTMGVDEPWDLRCEDGGDITPDPNTIDAYIEPKRKKTYPLVVDRNSGAHLVFPATVSVLGNEYALPPEVHPLALWDGEEAWFIQIQEAAKVAFAAINVDEWDFPPARAEVAKERWFHRCRNTLSGVMLPMKQVSSPLMPSKEPLENLDANLCSVFLASQAITELAQLGHRAFDWTPLEDQVGQPALTTLSTPNPQICGLYQPNA